MDSNCRESRLAGQENISFLAFSRRGVWDKDRSEHLNIHPFHQIVTVSDGMLLMEDQHRHQPLYENMAAFIPVGIPHMLGVMRENAAVKCNSLYIKPQVFKHNERSIKIFKISELGTSLLKELDKQNNVDLTRGIMGECLRLFMNLLRRDLARPINIISLPAARSGRVEAVIGFIEENYMDDLKLKDFSRAVSLSVRQITRSFQDEMSMSVMEYLKSFRLIQATEMLHDGRRKVIDIACDCGYNALSSFHSDFKHYFGCTPGEFRKLLSE